jgi:hypothetical protein
MGSEGAGPGILSPSSRYDSEKNHRLIAASQLATLWIDIITDAP